jgi:hypothetical protein
MRKVIYSLDGFIARVGESSAGRDICHATDPYV